MAAGGAARGGRSDLGSYLPPAAAQPADSGQPLKARLPPTLFTLEWPCQTMNMLF